MEKELEIELQHYSLTNQFQWFIVDKPFEESKNIVRPELVLHQLLQGGKGHQIWGEVPVSMEYPPKY